MEKVIEIKGLEIEVDGEDLFFSKDGKCIASASKFQDNIMKKEGMVAIIFTNHNCEQSGIAMTNKEFEEIIEFKEETEKVINDYFKNLNNVKLIELNVGSYAIKNKDKDYYELSDLNREYLEQKEQEWLEESTKHIVKTKDEWEENGMGQMEKVVEYTFIKENIGNIKQEKEEIKKNNKSEVKLGNEALYYELREMASKMTNEEFEDHTGLSREDYLE